MLKQSVGAFILFTLLYCFCIPAPASAHFDVTSGPYTFEFHLEPNDEPVSGENSTLYFTQMAAPANFNWDKCDCNLTITKDGNTFQSTRLQRMRTDYVFPEAGVYTLTVAGKPMHAAGFQDFTVSYQYRVTQGKTVPLANRIPVYLLAAVIALIAVTLALVASNHLKKPRH